MLFADAITSQINATTPQRGSTPNNQLDKDAFLRLLTAQLQNQDPLNPTDQENFIQQVATFSNLEQQITMNQQMSRLLQFQLIGQAASLIGQEVSGFFNGQVVEGTVREIIFVGGEPVLTLTNGQEMPHTALISIGARKSPAPDPVAPPAADPPAAEGPAPDPPADPPTDPTDE